ncbi:MAG: catalase, partial [Candidatus Competibacteraceae bacterium]|nr:catalase [Candidatus Competibacteraceae bacterium]
MRSLKNERAGFNITTSCDNPIEGLAHMFVDMVQKRRVEEQGQCPARRPVFLRTHGIIRGHIEILDDIPADYKQGMFACTGQHPVYVRYSSDLADGRPDWKSTIGIGIKMFDIPGQKVVSDDDANVADLLLQNVPFFFVDTARDMCAFTKASFEGWADEWVQENSPQTNILLDEMAKPIRSVFDTSLWSVVPFKLGDNHYCKYIVRPGTSTFADEVNTDDPDFLRKDLIARMAAGEASLDIFIQKRPDVAEYGEAYLDEHFPLDRATVVWDEKEAPPLKVAQIHLPQQDIATAEQEIYGDWLAFNIGRVPQENAPVGSVAEARMVVYKIAADYRRETNGQPLEEPSQPGLPEIENPTCPFPFQKPAGEQP